MKDQRDDKTLEMLPMPKKRGRPSTGKALTTAERQARFRERQKAKLEEMEQKLREAGIQI